MTVGVHFSGENLSALAVRFRASRPSSPSPTSTGLDFGDGRQLQAGHRRPSKRTAGYFGQVVSLVHARFREFCAPYSRRGGSRIVSIRSDLQRNRVQTSRPNDRESAPRFYLVTGVSIGQPSGGTAP